MKKTDTTLTEIMIVLVMITINALISICFFSDPVIGDSVYYTELADNIARYFPDISSASKNSTYSITDIPPLFVMLGSVFIMIFKNPVIGMRIFNLLCSTAILIIVYAIAKKETKNRWLAFAAAGFMMTNPFYIQFAGSHFILSESLSIMLILIGSYTYLYSKDKTYSAIFFSLSVLTRYVNLLLVSPLLLISAIKILRKNEIRKNMMFILIIIIPPAAWFLTIMLSSGSMLGNIYHVNDNAFDPENFIILAFKNILITGVAAPVIAVSFFFPIFGMMVLRNKKELKSIIRFFSFKTKEIKLGFSGYTLLLMVFYLFFLSLSMFMIKTAAFRFNITYIFSRTRYALPLLPFVIIISMMYISRLKKNRMAGYLYLGVSGTIMIALSMLLNFGYVQDKTGIDFFENTLVRRDHHRAQALEYMDHIESGKNVRIFFREPAGGMTGVNMFKEYYLFRNNADDDDFMYVVTDNYGLEEALAGCRIPSEIYRTEKPEAHVFICFGY